MIMASGVANKNQFKCNLMTPDIKWPARYGRSNRTKRSSHKSPFKATPRGRLIENTFADWGKGKLKTNVARAIDDPLHHNHDSDFRRIVSSIYCNSCQRNDWCKNQPNPLEKNVEIMMQSYRIIKAQRVCNPRSGILLRFHDQERLGNFKPKDRVFLGRLASRYGLASRYKMSFIGTHGIVVYSESLKESDRERLMKMGFHGHPFFGLTRRTLQMQRFQSSEIWRELDPCLKRGIILFSLFGKSGERPGGYHNKDIRSLLGTSDSTSTSRTRDALICLGILRKQRNRYHFSGDQLKPSPGRRLEVSEFDSAKKRNRTG